MNLKERATESKERRKERKTDRQTKKERKKESKQGRIREKKKNLPDTRIVFDDSLLYERFPQVILKTKAINQEQRVTRPTSFCLVVYNCLY